MVSYSFSTPFWSAFIRIQLETEQAERNKRKNNKRALIINQDSFEAMTFRHFLDLYEEQFKLMMLSKNK